MNLTKAKKMLEKKYPKSVIDRRVFVCKNCGNRVTGYVIDKDTYWCPICHMSKNRDMSRGKSVEKRVSRKMGGTLTPASGALGKKGDIWVLGEDDFGTVWELKSTKKNYISIKLEWFLKGIAETPPNMRFRLKLVFPKNTYVCDIFDIEITKCSNIYTKKGTKQFRFSTQLHTPICIHMQDLIIHVEEEL